MGTPIAQQLAEFLGTVRSDDLPEIAMEHAAMLVASTLASAASGVAIDSARIVREIAIERGGRPDSSLWFAGASRLPMAETAQANAVAASASASDDSDLRNIMHLGTPLTATVLALAEATGAGGEDVAAAMVCGYEAAGRIGEVMTPGYRNRGFHGCVPAVFSSTVAAGRLLGLTVPQLTHAIALAATSIGGLFASAHASIAREYHDGMAVLLGINATVAAGRGYTGDERILETKRGFIEAFSGADGAESGERLLRGLGDSWDVVTDLAVKLMPGAHPFHAFAEAAALAASDGDLRPSEIESIVVCAPGLTSLAGPTHPVDLVDMAHSQAFFIAAGAADRELTWAHARPEKIGDPVIQALTDKVSVGPQPDDATGYRCGATATITAQDGRTATRTVLVPHGAAESGLSWADIEGKYRALMPKSGLGPAAIDASLQAVRALRSQTSVAPLLASLVMDPAERPDAPGA